MVKPKRQFQSKYFNYNVDYRDLNLREHPELYSVGKGEQGVLMVQPYKSEILPYWRFKTPEIATESSNKIYDMFLEYKKKNDFVGMDMARKFLQMGYTRSRRYANHSSGRKYEKNPQQEDTVELELKARKNIRPQEEDWATNEKAQSARIFFGKYLLAKDDPDYLKMKKVHNDMQKKYQQSHSPQSPSPLKSESKQRSLGDFLIKKETKSKIKDEDIKNHDESKDGIKIKKEKESENTKEEKEEKEEDKPKEKSTGKSVRIKKEKNSDEDVKDDKMKGKITRKSKRIIEEEEEKDSDGDNDNDDDDYGESSEEEFSSRNQSRKRSKRN